MVNTASFLSLFGALFLATTFHGLLASAAQVVIESTDPRINYGPAGASWSAITDSAASGGSYHFSNSTNSVAYLEFTFRSFTLNAPRWPAPVKLQVRVDDTPYAVNLQDFAVPVDSTASPSSAGRASRPSGPVWTFEGGFQKPRSIRIMAAWNSDSSVVPLNVVDSLKAETVLVEDDNPLIVYTDPFEWFSRMNDGAASGASYHFSNVEGNKATLTYTFRSFSYNAPRWSRPLHVRILVDDESFDVDLQDTSVAADVDQLPMLGPARLTSSPLFAFDGGSTKSRTIQILPAANSTIPMIVVDAFSFTADSGPSPFDTTTPNTTVSAQINSGTSGFSSTSVSSAPFVSIITTPPDLDPSTPIDDNRNSLPRTGLRIAAVIGISAAAFILLFLLAPVLFLMARFLKRRRQARVQNSDDAERPSPFFGFPSKKYSSSEIAGSGIHISVEQEQEVDVVEDRRTWVAPLTSEREGSRALEQRGQPILDPMIQIGPASDVVTSDVQGSSIAVGGALSVPMELPPVYSLTDPSR
ncbi:hypothetical protein CVT24_001576 [Panaeolus cyanescens]|uniref:Dystroglycan-type cadherin-like domain-containing protein n=1 Tax=Panaeolus cyanescens TaxID=181874 RepID=A0A409YZ48_9AGAR|nr:hypothetical protein CVT24_001576 [Panaeolus cyanescens]